MIEGKRRRTQVFEGVVIKRQGHGARETFTVRKQSFGVGVERTFPLHSPKIERIEVAARGDVRRAKLYYLRAGSASAHAFASAATTGPEEQIERELLYQEQEEPSRPTGWRPRRRKRASRRLRRRRKQLRRTPWRPMRRRRPRVPRLPQAEAADAPEEPRAGTRPPTSPSRGARGSARGRRTGVSARPVASFVLELVVIVVIALGLAIGIQAFIVKPYRIPSGSMLPTLHINQRILVDRIGNDFSSPEIGNIYVFHPPKNYAEGCADPNEGENSEGQADPQAVRRRAGAAVVADVRQASGRAPRGSDLDPSAER